MTHAQHILEGLDGPLTLTIGLQMKCCTKMQLCAQFLVELLPETGGKSNISVGNNGDRNPVVSDDLADIHVGQLLGR